jgi:thymidine kinase
MNFSKKMLNNDENNSIYEVSNRIRSPEFIIYTGPMFGTKTTKLLMELDRATYRGQKVVACKPTVESRYSTSEIVTHGGFRFPAINLNSSWHLNEISKSYDVIGVDEAFMIEGVAEILIDLYKRGKTIVVSSVQLSAQGQPFEEISKMMPWATKIEVCPAVCPITGKDAFFTVRKDGEGKEIEVGGSDLYEPRAWGQTHFTGL